MFFLGIDLSLTGSGLCVINDKYQIVKTDLLSTPTIGVERLFHLESLFRNFIKPFSNEMGLICIEGAAYRESGKIYELGQWAGIVYLTLYKLSLEPLIVAPLQLKKYVSGKGKNKGKETILLDVFRNFGEEIRCSDIADAYVLARIAHDFFHFESIQRSLFQYQIEVIKKLRHRLNEQRKKELL